MPPPLDTCHRCQGDLVEETAPFTVLIQHRCGALTPASLVTIAAHVTFLLQRWEDAAERRIQIRRLNAPPRALAHEAHAMHPLNSAREGNKP
jgi:hypothetical protein